MISKKITAVVLAAGRSKRTKTSIPKVLLDLAGMPLIYYTLNTLRSTPEIGEIVVVVGHRKEDLECVVKKEFKGITFAVQEELNGTAKAVEAALGKAHSDNDILVLCADTPLIKASTLTEFVNFFFRERADCALITAFFSQKTDYGRIERDGSGDIAGIVEKVVDLASSAQEEVNSGIYIFRRAALTQGLSGVQMNPKKKEYFLTDCIGIFRRCGFSVRGFTLSDNAEMLGVNTQENLSMVRKVLNQRILNSLMDQGVTIVNPEATFVAWDAKIGKNSIVYPFTFIEKNVIIGSNCAIGPFVHVRQNARIKDNTVFNFSAELENIRASI